MIFLLLIILSAILVFLVMFINGYIKAMHDPDVIKANELGMLITHYKKYKEADAKIMELYREYGTDSEFANKEVTKIINALPNMNEWRRFEEDQMKQQHERMMSLVNDLYDGKLK